MGCQPSQSEKALGIRVNVLDSSFMRQKNKKSRSKMDELDIKYQVYLSISCFIEDMSRVYTNQIITTQELFKPLKKQLEKHNFHPNIYVLFGKKSKSLSIDQRQQSDYQLVKFCQSYQDIISQLQQKTLRKRKSTLNPNYLKSKEKIALKIFRNTNNQSSQEVIFEQTLKSKNVSYEIYKSYSDLEASIANKQSDFIVTDYVYHRQVINLVESSATKVICLCDFDEDQSFDSRVYFVTNNFLEVVSEVVSEKQLSHLNSVKCSRVYVYSNQSVYLQEYGRIIQSFDFQVKIYSDLAKIINQSKYHFAVTILINPCQRKQIQKILERFDYSFKTKLIQVQVGTQNSVKGLRKIIKQLKKGYKASKTIARSIDIIDKHFDNVKFDCIKKQLQKYEIKCYGYNNLNSYLKNKRFISPFIICSYQQRSLILRYLKQVQSKTKIILFCNKNNISSQLKDNKQFSFVSSHFGKIINFIKKNHVYNPYIIDQQDISIREKKEKLKKNNKRISALKWSGENSLNLLNFEQQKNIVELQKGFQFLNISSETSSSQIISIQKQSASLFKLQYSPFQKQQTFRQDMIASLRKLKSLFKINYPKAQFQKLLSEIQCIDTLALMNKVQQFFSSQNQMGLKINKSLIDIQKLSKQEIMSLRQYLFIVNMNYLTVYKDRFLGKIKLHHYLESNLIQKCQKDSYILNKNYCVFYQYNQKQKSQQKITPYIIQLQLEINSLAQMYPQFNGYFTFNNKFIFSPYSQFRIKNIRKSNSSTIISVQYKKNVEFLKSYFSENIVKSKNSIINVYEEELQKIKLTHKTSFLFNSKNQQQFKKNLLRTKAMIFFQNGQIKEAIKMQKQLIIRQQNLQNFNSQKLQWLNYELGCFYFKDNNHSQCKKILVQLLESQPKDILKQKIKALIEFYKQRQSKDQRQISNNDNQKEQIFKTIILQPTFAYYHSCQAKQMEELSEHSSSQQQNIFEPGQIQGQMPCLEIERGDFGTQFKENIC